MSYDQEKADLLGQLTDARKRVKELEIQLAEKNETANVFMKQVRKLQQRERLLREALEYLRDAQNGPPLITEQAFWEKAMEMTKTALAATGKGECSLASEVLEVFRPLSAQLPNWLAGTSELEKINALIKKLEQARGNAATGKEGAR